MLPQSLPEVVLIMKELDERLPFRDVYYLLSSVKLRHEIECI